MYPSPAPLDDVTFATLVAREPALGALEYSLPEDRIARHPPAERDGGLLLTALTGQPIADRLVTDLPSLLRPGDLLVVNEARVHRARLRARRASGGAVEVMLCAPGPGSSWEALVRPGRRLTEGERLACGSGAVVLHARHQDGSWTVSCEPDADALTASAGEVPLPPYLGRAATPEDEARYQTVYAQQAGPHRAAAAPTAGLHFTPALLAELQARGVERVAVSLEVGAGTFRPLEMVNFVSGELHAERFEVSTAAWEAIVRARSEGRRIVAVGTTAARVLESAEGPGAGVTRIFIRPGFAFRRVDALITNFHLPRSSLLLLVAALAGTDRIREAYIHALATRYRFFSYGDAMLLEASSVNRVESW